MALSLYNPFFWVALVSIFLFLIFLQRRLGLRWWPAWILRGAILAVVLVAIFYPEGKPTNETYKPTQILIIDRSASIQADELARIKAKALLWQAESPERTVLLADSETAVMLNSDSDWGVVAGPSSYLDKAVKMAVLLIENSIHPADASILLASDGLATDQAAMEAEIQKLADQGIRLDVIPLQPHAELLDIYTGPLIMPTIIWENTPLRVLLPVHNLDSEISAALTFETTINGVSRPLTPISAGAGFYVFQMEPQPFGIVTVGITVKLEGDPDLENNSSYATAQVLESPRVLVISPEPVPHFLTLLADHGILAEVTTPEDFYTVVPVLDQFGVIFIDDFLAGRLSIEHMNLLRTSVVEKGKGLVFLGGKNSYTLGGYENTPLESILPVRLVPPIRSDREPLIFALMVDNSSSMGTGKPGSTPLDLGKEAAMRAIELLNAEDQLGILVFSTDPIWSYPINPLGDGLALRTAMDTISMIRTSGGTLMYKALLEVVEGMRKIPQAISQHRNILILTDGNSADGNPQEFEQLSREALQEKIIISTIGLGADTDSDLLRNISEWGGGRYYIAKTAEDLPRIMMNESRAARSENIQTGETGLMSGEVDHPLLSGIIPTSFPTLTAYNALTSKKEEGAEDILLSTNLSDPILSVWQVGLGRVAAWMTDLGQDWCGAWGNEADEGLFWSQIVRYALPNPSLGPAQAFIKPSDTQLIVSLLLRDKNGNPLNFADPKLQYTDAELKLHTFNIPQVSAGEYVLKMDRPALGAYRAIITYNNDSEKRQEIRTPFSVNPPEESHSISPAEISLGRENLLRWAFQTGGAETALSLKSPDGDTINPDEKRNFLFLILIGLVVTWPIEIAIRRRWLPWRSLN